MISKKQITVIFSLAVLAGLLLFLEAKMPDRQILRDNIAQESRQPRPVAKGNIAMPPGYPQRLVPDAQAEVLGVLLYPTPDGGEKAVIHMQSPRQLDEAVGEYEAYFKVSGWTLEEKRGPENGVLYRMKFSGPEGPLELVVENNPQLKKTKSTVTVYKK